MEYLYRWRGTVVAPWGTFVPGSEGPSTMEYLCLGGRGLEHHRVPLSLGIMPLSLAADGRGTIENVCLWQWKAGATWSTFVSGGGPLSLAEERRSTMEYLLSRARAGRSTLEYLCLWRGSSPGREGRGTLTCCVFFVTQEQAAALTKCVAIVNKRSLGAGKTLHVVRDRKRITGSLILCHKKCARVGVRGNPTKMMISDIVKIANNASKNKSVLASTYGISRITAMRDCKSVAQCYMTLQEILATWLLSQLERHPPSFVGDNWIWDETGQSMTVKLEFERVALGAAQRLRSITESQFSLVSNILQCISIYLTPPPWQIGCGSPWSLLFFLFIYCSLLCSLLSLVSVVTSAF